MINIILAFMIGFFISAIWDYNIFKKFTNKLMEELKKLENELKE